MFSLFRGRLPHRNQSSQPCSSQLAAAVKAARQQGASELSGEARPQTLAAASAQRPAANELDLAYETIPVEVRPELEAAAHERLSAAGVPGFLRILPTIRDMMVRLWLGEAVPVLVTR